MGWYHGFKLHLLCNDSGEVITFKLKEANVDDRDSWMWEVFTKELFGKMFADRGYIKQELFECLFDLRIHLVHGLKANMKKKLMPMWDNILLRKRTSLNVLTNYSRTKHPSCIHATIP